MDEAGGGGRRALVVLAPGAEEMEAVIAVDVLRRAEVEVVLAGVHGPDPVTCSRGVRIVPDRPLAEVRQEPFDALVIPGGAAGAAALAASGEVCALVRACEASGRLLGAICAGPSVLVAAGAFAGRALTSHPVVRELLAAHGRYREEPVVRDGNLITSRGPGTAFAFALALVEALCGAERAAAVAAPMMLPAG
ncbi:MAG: 4-methyl-5(B-hydroxyethyl)-thiazole monophosphate biosynthesis protein [Planctomycetota bacterium]|nr:MAG: 4-methyl-5(B-hydroxyethyl)-thiazole monophosphate biosynthesis protein [Planctomycetota bacterium]